MRKAEQFEAAIAANPGLYSAERVEFVRDLLHSEPDVEAIAAAIKGYKKSPFRYVEFSEFASAKPPTFLIKGAIVEGSVHAFYGPTQAGKTFAALDMAMCVATGRPWFDKPVEQAAVLWLAAEDPGGVMLRARAWGLHHQITPSNFVVMEGNLFNLRRADTLDAVILYANRLLRKSGMERVLVVIDTLVRAAPGADEISGKDTGEIVAAFDRIRYSLPSTVCIIHHSGKNEDAGLRGHSSLGQGIDSFARVSKAGSGSFITFEKVKNAKLPPTLGFELKVIAVDLDADADIVDSCVVIPRDIKPVELGNVPVPEAMKQCRDTLATEIATEGVPIPQAFSGHEGTKGVTLTAWRAAFKSRNDHMPTGTFRQAWSRAHKRLLEDGHVVACDMNGETFVFLQVLDTS